MKNLKFTLLLALVLIALPDHYGPNSSTFPTEKDFCPSPSIVRPAHSLSYRVRRQYLPKAPDPSRWIAPASCSTSLPEEASSYMGHTQPSTAIEWPGMDS